MVSGNNYIRVNYNYSDKKAHPSAHRNIVPREVLMKTGLRPLNTARPVNTAHPKTIIYSARPMSHFSKSAQPTVKRPYQMRTTLTNKNSCQKVNTTKGKFNTARPKAVNAARPNTAVVNAIRSDANYARDHTTQRTVHSRKRGKLLKKLTTRSLVHLTNLEDSIEQQGQDSTKETTEILAIKNQGASIKTMEIQIGQMSKVLQERGIESLPSSTEPNPWDHVKSISTAKADSTGIRHIRSCPHAVSDSQYSNLFSKTILFPKRLHGYYYDEWKEACKVKILETYDHALPQKEKDPGSFTLPCFIHNVCFDKALVDLGASVSVRPFSTYNNLGLGDLAHIKLTVELADRTIKHPRGIAENMIVRIGFSIIDDTDITSGVLLGMPFCKKFVSCQRIMERFAYGDEYERMNDNE
ncbi:retrotransposon protein [Tanacetum coccineum]